LSVYGGAPAAAEPTVDCAPGARLALSVAGDAAAVWLSAGFGVLSPGGGGVVDWLVWSVDTRSAGFASSCAPQPDSVATTTDTTSIIGTATIERMRISGRGGEP
jgi:hypothetical protein